VTKVTTRSKSIPASTPKSGQKSRTVPKPRPQLPKAATGIKGLDEITEGGLPKGRPTLVCGGAGCGKTLLAMEFLVRGATEFNEPGVFMAFEETADDLTQNIASLGFDLKDLIARKKIVLDYVYVERSEIEESGEYDLEGLFIRLGAAIDAIGAKRVVLDTIEMLFSGLPGPLILRAELRRLFRWLKDKGVTAIITGERGDGTLTRQGLEEYVSDCVIVLDHRVDEQASSRRLRVVKYRGSTHGTNEYPFLIDEDGFSVLPVTATGLDHTTSSERIPSGIARLDTMLGGKGFYRGSSILISGTAGTGKSSLVAHFTEAACRRGDRVLYFSFEESPDQIIRNMRSIGIDLQPWLKKGQLQFHATRPSEAGLEMHLVNTQKAVNSFKPHVVIMDPLSAFSFGNNRVEVKSMLIRLIDFLKTNQITGVFTNLTEGGAVLDQTDLYISSLIDTWLLLRNFDSDNERNRCISILKSRGMAHSNQTREFTLTDHGVELRDASIGQEGMLTGAARRAKEAENEAALLRRKRKIEARRAGLERDRTALEVKIAQLRAEFMLQEADLQDLIDQQEAHEK